MTITLDVNYEHPQSSAINNNNKVKRNSPKQSTKDVKIKTKVTIKNIPFLC